MQRYTGHNPMGGLSVIALLGIVALQALSGLFSNDDIASEGPLVRFISPAMVARGGGPAEWSASWRLTSSTAEGGRP